MKILFLHGWHCVPGGVKLQPSRDQLHSRKKDHEVRTSILFALAYSVSIAITTTHAEEGTKPRPDGFKALDYFVGSWNTTSTNKVIPDVKTTVQESTVWILKNL